MLGLFFGGRRYRERGSTGTSPITSIATPEYGEDIFTAVLEYRCCPHDFKDWCTMKRSQVDEDNCGHWECEVQHPEGGTLDQSWMPRSFGTTTTRRLRFLRASIRDFAAGMTLVGMASRVDDTCSTLQSALTDVPASLPLAGSRRTCLTVVETNDKPSGSHDGNGSVMSGVLDATEDPMFSVHEDQATGSTQSVVDEPSQVFTSASSHEPVSGAVTDKPQQDLGEDNCDKENLDPLGDWTILPHRSPLPEWFPRIPLQDITNVLACDLDDEQPQPKKKRNKKIGSTLAPTLLTLRDTPVQNAATIIHPKPFGCATLKQSQNLRRNFR